MISYFILSISWECNLPSCNGFKDISIAYQMNEYVVSYMSMYNVHIWSEHSILD